MSVLTKKLWRTIRSTRGQFLALTAVVMVGIIVYISMNTSYYNLDRSKERFYRDNNFADYYFHLVKAPQEVIKQIEAVPGVVRATGRIQKDVPVLKAGNQRATARLTSYPLPMETEVNRLQLLSGRLFEKYPGGGIEVLLDPQSAAANNWNPGSQVQIVAEGRLFPLTVVGTATSPEFAYPMKDAASMMPEPESFGIIMIPHNQAQQILNLAGQINQVVVQFAPGTNSEQIANQIKTILTPYGNLASYPRKQQLSHAMIQGEIDGLESQSVFLPAVFLIIAAAIQFVMLGRMIRTQRMQIGVMKALGYTSWQIIGHYTSYALAVAVAGSGLGALLGIWLAGIFSDTYAMYFNLPQAIGGINYRAIGTAFALSLGAGAISGFTASYRITSINPADSMRPEPPQSVHKLFIERWIWLWAKLAGAWRLGLRSINRNRSRFAITVFGIIFAVGMLIVTFCFQDSINYLLKTHYGEEQRYDYLVRFAAPVRDYELLNITHLNGVLSAEPMLEIPVKVHAGSRSADDVLLGLPPDVKLKKLVGEEGQPLALPASGLLLDVKTARKLNLEIGDEVLVETTLGLGPARYETIKIAGVNRQLAGGGSYISLEQANRVLQERGLISGAMLKVDPGQAREIENKLNEMTGVASSLSRQKELDNFNRNLEMMVYAVTVLIAFAVTLGFAIVYNSSVISFAERQRELASLRVIGFTVQEVNDLLLKETLIQSVLGILLGLPFGNLLARAYVKAVSTDLFTMPVAIYPLTYLYSALIGLGFILLAHRLAVKGIKNLSMVEVLKNRD